MNISLTSPQTCNETGMFNCFAINSTASIPTVKSVVPVENTGSSICTATALFCSNFFASYLSTTARSMIKFSTLSLYGDFSILRDRAIVLGPVIIPFTFAFEFLLTRIFSVKIKSLTVIGDGGGKISSVTSRFSFIPSILSAKILIISSLTCPSEIQSIPAFI